MKTTEERLKQIIAEELTKALNEMNGDSPERLIRQTLRQLASAHRSISRKESLTNEDVSMIEDIALDLANVAKQYKTLNEADLGPDARGETDVTKAVFQMLMSDGFRQLRKQFNLIIPAVDASVVKDIAKHFKMR
mgnify:CR=1 FL=1|tara:strand:+ start:162 stop:566 length:405 start_codon:yes stop_codon:yes gene_type:complete